MGVGKGRFRSSHVCGKRERHGSARVGRKEGSTMGHGDTHKGHGIRGHGTRGHGSARGTNVGGAGNAKGSAGQFPKRENHGTHMVPHCGTNCAALSLTTQIDWLAAPSNSYDQISQYIPGSAYIPFLLIHVLAAVNKNSGIKIRPIFNTLCQH
jgi:hypothetical protein